MGLTFNTGLLSDAIKVSSTLNVGIGTSSPAEILEVFAPAVAGTSQQSRLRITQAGSISARANLVSGVISGENPYFAIETRQSASPFAIVERLRIDGNGNVGIGTSSLGSWAKLQVASNMAISGTGYYFSNDFVGGVTPAWLEYNYTNGNLDLGSYGPSANGYIRFIAGGTTERMRITSSGWFKAANNGVFLNINGNYHELTTSISDNIFIASNYSSTPYGPYMWFVNASPNNTTQYFLLCDDSVNSKAAIYSNGTFGSRTGTYGSIISDIKYKQDITDANSQWDDIKNLRVVNFKYKEDVELEGENALRQIGFIAQEVEAVSPNLVYEAGKKDTEETWKSVKTSIIHLKAVKALQEAMARIEELEAKVTALENKS